MVSNERGENDLRQFRNKSPRIYPWGYLRTLLLVIVLILSKQHNPNLEGIQLLLAIDFTA